MFLDFKFDFILHMHSIDSGSSNGSVCVCVCFRENNKKWKMVFLVRACVMVKSKILCFPEWPTGCKHQQVPCRELGGE